MAAKNRKWRRLVMLILLSLTGLGRLREPDGDGSPVVLEHLFYVGLPVLTVKAPERRVGVQRRLFDLLGCVEVAFPRVDRVQPEPGPVCRRNAGPLSNPGEWVERDIDAEAGRITWVGRTEHGQEQEWSFRNTPAGECHAEIAFMARIAPALRHVEEAQ